MAIINLVWSDFLFKHNSFDESYFCCILQKKYWELLQYILFLSFNSVMKGQQFLEKLTKTEAFKSNFCFVFTGVQSHLNWCFVSCFPKVVPLWKSFPITIWCSCGKRKKKIWLHNTSLNEPLYCLTLLHNQLKISWKENQILIES